MTRLEEVTLKEQRLRALMSQKGLEGIWIRKQPNFSWFTGGGLNMVGIATEMGVTSLLITRTGRYLIANNIEAGRMLDEEGLADLGFQVVDQPWHDENDPALVEKIAGSLASVGTDAALGECQNVEGDIRKLRFSLTASEIDRYRFLGERLSRAVEKVALGVRPGDAECEIAGRIAPELWKDRIDPTGFQVAADERALRYRHPIPTTRLVKRYVMICVNARYKGLITTITRLVHIGRPDPTLVAQYAANLEIENRMIAATRFGVAASVPFAVGLAAYKELGYETEWTHHHQGGAMGYYARDIKVTAATAEPIAENQAYCWNPSIAGTKTEDGFIVTPQGPIMITFPVIYPRIAYPIAKAPGGVIARPGLLVLD
jgi:Xaa-Pro dipeptidase